MPKPLLPILIVLALAGGVYAALTPALFPDTPLFPRVPTGTGTIGSIIAKILGTTDLGGYTGDGTARNTLALSGVTASGYLKNTTCDSTQKWTGIDANGKAICGTSTTLLVEYGTVKEQGCDATYYRADSTQGTTSTGFTLKTGDIIKTGACGLTIAFADLSILRLDADTTVSLDITMSNGTSIASAILANGSLWGRILTETGSYSIGTDKIVAGVRGTSIAIVSTGNTLSTPPTTLGTRWNLTKTQASLNNTMIAVIDSTGSITGYAADISSVNTQGGKTLLRTLAVGQKADISPTILTNITNTINGTALNEEYRTTTLRNTFDETVSTQTTRSADTIALYTTSPWIRQNTLKDIAYMYDILANPGSNLAPTKQTKILAELTETKPANTSGTEASNLCETSKKWWTPRYGCQASNLYAIADFTKPSISDDTVADTSGTSPPTDKRLTLLYSGATSIEPAGVTSAGNFRENNEGYYISGQGYISYTGTILQNLAGKTIEIEFDSLPDGNNGITPANNLGNTILDFGDTLRVVRNYQSRAWKCVYGSINTVNCDSTDPLKNTSPFIVDPTSISNTLRIKVLSSFRSYITPSSRFVIGNSQASSYIQPINKTIKSIRVVKTP